MPLNDPLAFPSSESLFFCFLDEPRPLLCLFLLSLESSFPSSLFFAASLSCFLAAFLALFSALFSFFSFLLDFFSFLSFAFLFFFVSSTSPSSSPRLSFFLFLFFLLFFFFSPSTSPILSTSAS